MICICLFIGAMGKSAQVPLHVWLPDSMEGPTPISALIHAATMVTAGIFMVARMSPLFEHSETALSFVLVIGATTALFMGLLGIVNNDIKRVIAYSTLSQLGYMTVALGVSAYAGAIFHLMTHAFFKALLFLAAGSVIIAMHHEQDMRKMGGLRKYMPITYATSLIGSLALIGFPGFSGFFSKDALIEAVHESQLPGAAYAYWCVLIGVFVTAFYTFRLLFMTFHGKERFDDMRASRRAWPRTEHGHDDSRSRTWWTAAREPVGRDAAARAARDPVGRDRLVHDRAAAVRRLLWRCDPGGARARRARARARGVPRPGAPSCCTASRSPVDLARVRRCRRRLVPVSVPARTAARACASVPAPLYTLLVNKYYFDAFNEKVLAPAVGPSVTRCGAAAMWP